MFDFIRPQLSDFMCPEDPTLKDFIYFQLLQSITSDYPRANLYRASQESILKEAAILYYECEKLISKIKKRKERGRYKYLKRKDKYFRKLRRGRGVKLFEKYSKYYKAIEEIKEI